MFRCNALPFSLVLFVGVLSSWGEPASLLESLSQAPDFETHRIASNDNTGGNADWIEIDRARRKSWPNSMGRGRLRISGTPSMREKYYSRMLILRFYWDGRETPSVEMPLGDFFRRRSRLEPGLSEFSRQRFSEGRARNCYWYMPFRKSAKVTVTHEGFYKVPKFYYYMDYRTYPSLPEDVLYFHAQYRQAVPNDAVDLKGKKSRWKNQYVLLETTGKGQYMAAL